MKNPIFSVVDIETTGHSPENGDRMMQIAIVQIQQNKIIHTYNQFIHPEQPIPAFISELTHITDEDVADAPTFDAFAHEIAERLTGTIFVAHNTHFDLSFIQKEFKRCGQAPFVGATIDTVELAKIICPSADSYRLQDLAAQFGISLSQAHRADEDAYATAELLLHLFNKIEQFPLQTIRALYDRSFVLQSDLKGVFYHFLKRATHEHPSHWLYHNIPVRPEERSKERSGSTEFPSNPEAIQALIQSINPTYEKRQQQLDYMESIHSALLNEKEVAIEMPSGSGKTFGYLLPAIYYAKEQNRPVVVSTHSNFLVDSMLEKELLQLEKKLPFSFETTVVKGREQYIDLDRFQQVLQLTDHSYDETLTILQLIVWLNETKTGDLNEVNVSGGGHLLLDRTRKREKTQALPDRFDFHQRAIQQAKKSTVIITNHSLILSKQFQRLLPSIIGLIIDEAHHLIDTSLRVRETTLSFRELKYWMGKSQPDESQLIFKRTMQVMQSIGHLDVHRMKRMLRQYEQFSYAFDQWMKGLVSQLQPKLSKVDGKQYFSLAALKTEDIQQQFQVFLREMMRYIHQMEEWSAEAAQFALTDKQQYPFKEWQEVCERMNTLLTDCMELWSTKEHQSYATLIQAKGNSLPSSIQFVKRPLYSASFIRHFKEQLVAYPMGLIWTGGVLQVQDYPDFVMNQLGLQHLPIQSFPPAATLLDQTSLFLVKDIEWQDEDQTKYVEDVVDAIVQTAQAMDGKTFISFHSLQMMKTVYQTIQDIGLLEEYSLLAYNVTPGSDERLIRRFKVEQKAILFGTHQFFERVDVKDSPVHSIIIVRLPFTSPKHPLYQLKSTAYLATHEHPFYHFGLPEALVKFKQSFHLLLRNAQEKSAFIVLDPRIETKAYGVHFLRTIPQLPVKKVVLYELGETLRQWKSNDES